jgi:hypothetical protein
MIELLQTNAILLAATLIIAFVGLGLLVIAHAVVDVSSVKPAQLPGMLQALGDFKETLLLRPETSKLSFRITSTLFVESRRIAIRLLLAKHASFPTRRRNLPNRERVCSLLDCWSALLPTRIAQEDLGDFIEVIMRRIDAGQRWRVYLNVASAIFWTGLNAIGYAMKAVGKKSAG